jgi:hypothetical protein
MPLPAVEMAGRIKSESHFAIFNTVSTFALAKTVHCRSWKSPRKSFHCHTPFPSSEGQELRTP